MRDSQPVQTVVITPAKAKDGRAQYTVTVADPVRSMKPDTTVTLSAHQMTLIFNMAFGALAGWRGRISEADRGQ